MMTIRRLTYILLTLAVSLVADSCIRDYIDDDGGLLYVEGRETVISLRISVPAMSIATRADMPEGKDAQINSLWVGIFNANTGNCTYSDFPNIYPNENHGEFVTLKIPTLSGPSYIVAVGNPVDNRGYIYNENGESQGSDLAELLRTVKNWETYKKIVIRQLAVGDVSTPTDNLVMSGIYYENKTGGNLTDDPANAAEWETINTQSVNIPASGDSKVVALPGAVHLRRLISQVKFHFEVGDYDSAVSADDTVKGADGSTDVPRNNSKPGRRIIEVIPHSFQVFNAPYTSWLHERKSGDENGVSNSGDAIKIIGNSSISYNDAKLPLKANYRSSSAFNGNQYFDPVTVTRAVNGVEQEDTAYEFDFWMLENKRWASYDLYSDLAAGEDPYNRREKEQKSKGNPSMLDDSNTGIYTALCGDGDETMNNSAAYVKVSCRVIYTDEGLDAIQGEFDYKDVQYRSAEAIYVIHMGGINSNWNDFTHRRNHKYTYNVKVVDIDRIIVEAKGDETSETRPDIEGVVTDVVNPPFDVDCHYGVFNIVLTNVERTGGFDADGQPIYPNRKFPWRIRVFDGNKNLIYIDQDTFEQYDKLYWQWIELRPTTDEFTLAEYKPHDYDWEADKEAAAKGKTFYLTEVADITNFPGLSPEGVLDKNDARTSEDVPNFADESREVRWYTVFVNEYAYESSKDETNDNWIDYVNLDPRMCWFNTRFYSSKDLDSNYIRSKYVVRQQSIQTFYDASAMDRHATMNAIGMEHINETFGFNLRWDDITTRYDSYPYDGDNTNPSHDIKNNNGRHNTLLYIAGQPGTDSNNQTKGGQNDGRAAMLWTDYLVPTRLQMIEGINTASNQYGITDQLKESPYLIGDDRYENYWKYTTKERMQMGIEPYYVTTALTYTNGNDGMYNMSISNVNERYYLRILDACMNRNRDNNGNGVIDIDEIRWYVPASSEIVDLVIGRLSLETPLIDYKANTALSSPTNIQTELPHQSNTRFHYATSNQRTLWSEEGASLNPEFDYAKRNDGDESKWDWNLPPQNVRCVRALGTDLRTDLNADLTPAFTVDDERLPSKIYPTYFESKNLRSASPNIGIDSHKEYTEPNRLGYGGFEFDPYLYEFDKTIVREWKEGTIEIPHSAGYYADNGNGEYLGSEIPDDPEWSAKNPVWKPEERSGYQEAGMYLADPDKYYGKNNELNPGYLPSAHFDAFIEGGVEYPAGQYTPKTGTWSSDPDPNKIWFDASYGNYEAGYYEPEYHGNNWVPGAVWLSAFILGGISHEEGYYGPLIGSLDNTTGNDNWHPDGRHARFEEFWTTILPAGYYADNGDGEYLGTEVPKDPNWIDDNKAVWRPAWTEEVADGGWVEREFGTWQTPDWGRYDPNNKVPVFVMPFKWISDYSSELDKDKFVADHGLTLEQANKVCVQKHNNQSGWRLPNMKEAALIKVAMERAGMYKTKVFHKKGDNNEWDDPYWQKEELPNGYHVGNFLTCTFREFGVNGDEPSSEATGYYTGVYYPECEGESSPGDFWGDDNEYLMGRVACITTQWNRHFYIRCVRDLPDTK